MSRKPVSGILIITAFLCAMAILAQSGRGEKAKPASAVGTETCLGCHDGKDKTLAAGSHKALLLQKQAKKGIQPGCEACHGAGGDHVGSAPKGIVNFKAAKDFAKSCLACHGSDGKIAGWEHSTHSKSGVLCNECHSLHIKKEEKKTAAKEKDAACEKCHSDVSAQFKQVSRHPVPEKKMKCSDCHNPHSAGTAAGASSSLSQVCASCHTEKAGPFLFQHAPVAEDCVSCHSPHGSAADKLLATRVPNLCLQCHPGVLNDHAPVQASTSLRNCLACHKSVHGSNNTQNLTY